MKTYKLLSLCSLLFLMACGDDSSSANNVDPENKSSSSEETISSSSSGNNEKVSSSSENDPVKLFKTRKPKEETYTCKATSEFNSGLEEKFDQKDWICSFKYAGKEGFIYVQTTPTDCEAFFSVTPIMSVDTAVFYIDGKYETVKDLTYEWGGNHHNDSFRFTYNGKVYEYDHSSYGWGYRSCQEMDCLRVYEADGETLIEDGCGAYEEDMKDVRTLPVVCRFADYKDGSFGKFVDKFELCEGDIRLQEPIDD